jgi:hypothetical protein
MGSNAFSSASIAAAMNWAVSLAYRQVAKTIDAMAEAK